MIQNAEDTVMQMTEAELAEELAESLVILTTTSPDKRRKFGTLFASMDMDGDGNAGVNFYFTHSGQLKIVPVRTPEKESDYDENLLEKASLQMESLREQDRSIRTQLKSHPENAFDPDTVNIIGMTEDSGWEISFDHLADAESKKRAFLEAVREQFEPSLRTQDTWLLEKMEDNGFPGPNLKPLQEHLESRLHELMEIIYHAAEKADIDELRYKSHSDVCFVSPSTGKIFSKLFESTGTLLTKEQYEDRLCDLPLAQAINSDFVHVPDDQAVGEHKTLAEIGDDVLTQPNCALPASSERRAMTEWLQELVGTRQATPIERDRPVKVAFASPGFFDRGEPLNEAIPLIPGYAVVEIPTREDLQNCPDINQLGDADAIVVMLEDIPENGWNLKIDPNLAFAVNVAVTVETDPASMNIPIILHNKDGRADNTLRLLGYAFIQGRLMGDFPFYVTNTDEECRELLNELQNVKQRRPVVEKDEQQRSPEPAPPVDRVPNDGKMSVFVAGGHNNNSKRDLEEAFDLGYLLASMDIRIVTGGGQLEGSMGAVHTGFVQYHLDQINVVNINDLPETTRNDLSSFYDHIEHRYDAEALIAERPDVIDDLASGSRGVVPADMFYAYSTEPLIKMESPNGRPPPATTFAFTGNRERRKFGLYAAGTKLFLPGSIGTDEEFMDSLEQHLEARLSSNANDNTFADGTPDDQGMIIVYNRAGNLDKLLGHFNLLGDDPVTRLVRERQKIIIADNLEELRDALEDRAEKAQSWQAREEERQTPNPDSALAARR